MQLLWAGLIAASYGHTILVETPKSFQTSTDNPRGHVSPRPDRVHSEHPRSHFEKEKTPAQFRLSRWTSPVIFVATPLYPTTGVSPPTPGRRKMKRTRCWRECDQSLLGRHGQRYLLSWLLLHQTPGKSFSWVAKFGLFDPRFKKVLKFLLELATLESILLWSWSNFSCPVLKTN